MLSFFNKLTTYHLSILRTPKFENESCSIPPTPTHFLIIEENIFCDLGTYYVIF